MTLQVSGWWTYAFCHNEYVKQFHQAPPQQGSPIYPPIEDPNMESYFLGRTTTSNHKNDPEVYGEDESPHPVQIPSKGSLQISKHKNLVHKLSSGTHCELINQPREVEIQFQCNPVSGDRIAWIKELVTCKYVMVVWTPRLCHDVVFDNTGDVQHLSDEQIECKRVKTHDDDPIEMLLPAVSDLPLPTSDEPLPKTRANYVNQHDSVDEDYADYLQENIAFAGEDVKDEVPLEQLRVASLSLIAQLQADLDQGGDISTLPRWNKIFRDSTGSPRSINKQSDYVFKVEVLNESNEAVIGEVDIAVKKGVASLTDYRLVKADDTQQWKQEHNIPPKLKEEMRHFVQGGQGHDVLHEEL